ncbi:hypothetical protein Trydic_g21398 [Trypoxylus dichotomus]
MTATMRKIASLARRQYRITLARIQGYMSSVMINIVIYAASVWAKNAKQVKPKQNLNAAQRGVLLALTRAYHTISADAVQVVASVLPMDLEVLKVAAEYWWRSCCLLNLRVGRRLYRLLTNVRERLAIEHLQPSRGLIRFLVGHSTYPQYLCDRGLAGTDLCDCEILGTQDHVLLEWPTLRGVADDERNALSGVDLQQALRLNEHFSVSYKLGCQGHQPP